MSEGEAPRVVVVEDDQVNRDAVVRALTRMGYQVTAFAEAEAALDHLRSEPDVSLVITLLTPELPIRVRSVSGSAAASMSTCSSVARQRSR